MSFEPSLIRRSLDELLARFPFFDLLEIDWQWVDELGKEHGPWVLVKLGQPSESETEAWAVWPFAIWKTTGNVYGMDVHGAVEDDPIIEVTPL